MANVKLLDTNTINKIASGQRDVASNLFSVQILRLIKRLIFQE